MSTGEETVRLDRQTGERLVEHARAIVGAAARDDSPPDPPELPVLAEDRGVFVTLKQDGELRGCIGRPQPDGTLAEALEAAATGAATSDPRFPPLSLDEIGNVTVAVSVLTPPEPLPDVNPDAIEVGRDGLIVSKGRRSGLLLPQVAVDRGWTAAEFLRGAVRKAGLPPDAWRDEEMTVKRFSAQVFAEEFPGGPVPLEDYTRKSPNGQSTD
ncbi:AmmeMemoRadiSam system protein A [Halorhabdus amylolytica]|uniref:AmmeMemoRadiSam system protein A n=1 Tax=Halorhabdus amylolytica TaxID=2559573 RepID=UPI0010AA4E82|nr:AmmeMemoRadiSam system protein A [Halorhabdus amylolytica]